jgi:hypothetical protein
MNRRDLILAAGAAPALALGQAADWKPLTFDAHQNETVVLLSDILIPATDTPGAKEANVNRYIDLFLTDGPEEQRNQFLEGLAWLDNYSVGLHGKTFREASAAQRTAIVEKMINGGAPEPVRDFGRMAKVMTARVYYNTAIGYRELNKGGRVPRTFACKA